MFLGSGPVSSEKAWSDAVVVGIASRSQEGGGEGIATEAAGVSAQLESRDEGAGAENATVTRSENGDATDP